MILAGIPPATTFAGMSCVTTAFAAMRQFSPMVQPAVTTTCDAIQEPFPITIGETFAGPYR